MVMITVTSHEVTEKDVEDSERIIIRVGNNGLSFILFFFFFISGNRQRRGHVTSQISHDHNNTILT